VVATVRKDAARLVIVLPIAKRQLAALPLGTKFGRTFRKLIVAFIGTQIIAYGHLHRGLVTGHPSQSEFARYTNGANHTLKRGFTRLYGHDAAGTG
jgi:hypothetical protein